MPMSDIFLKLLKPVKDNENKETCNKKDCKEDLEEQPDLFNPEISDFYFNDEEIKVRDSGKGYKEYIFDDKSGNKVDSMLSDPADIQPVVELLANAYLDDNDFANVLKNANRQDFLVFNTTKNGPIRIPVNDIFDMLAYLKRERRFQDVNESEDEDWKKMWKQNKQRFESTNNIEVSREKNESFTAFVKRIQKTFNESVNK